LAQKRTIPLKGGGAAGGRVPSESHTGFVGCPKPFSIAWKKIQTKKRKKKTRNVKVAAKP